MSNAASVKQSLTTHMDNAVEHLKRDLAGLRTGRASVALLDGIRVDYYGTMTPLKQIANISTPEARLITIQPWEPQLIKEIEKALANSGLGVNPSNDGKMIRVPLPPLTEERRKELIKVVKHEGEGAKVAVRNLRRDANDRLGQEPRRWREGQPGRGRQNAQHRHDDGEDRTPTLEAQKPVDRREAGGPRRDAEVDGRSRHSPAQEQRGRQAGQAEQREHDRREARGDGSFFVHCLSSLRFPFRDRPSLAASGITSPSGESGVRLGSGHRRLPMLRLFENFLAGVIREPVQVLQVSTIGAPQRALAIFGDDRPAVGDLTRPPAVAALQQCTHLLPRSSTKTVARTLQGAYSRAVEVTFLKEVGNLSHGALDPKGQTAVSSLPRGSSFAALRKTVGHPSVPRRSAPVLATGDPPDTSSGARLVSD